MKKLFVSVPMKGRTETEIKASIQKMKKIAEVYEGEELELIDSYLRLIFSLELRMITIGVVAILKDRLPVDMTLKLTMFQQIT